MSKFLLLLSAILWGISLMLPGIIFEPDLVYGAKHTLCNLAHDKQYQCYLPLNLGGFSCETINIEMKDRVPASRDDINQFCGTDWETMTERPHILSGYDILLEGWLGIILGVFSWYGNLTWLIASINILCKRYKDAWYLSLLSCALGLSALVVRATPRDEGGGVNWVQHLGSGYYLWLVALLIPGVVAYWKLKQENPALVTKKVIVSTLLLILIPASVPALIAGYLKKKGETKMTNVYNEERKAYKANLMNDFKTELLGKNYKVTIQESQISLYFDHGELVRVGGDSTKDLQANYMIYKNGYVYTVNAAQKVFTEVIGKKGDEESADLKKMESVSGLGFLLSYNEQIPATWWEHGENKNSQAINRNGTSIEVQVDPDTHLVTLLTVKAENIPAVTRHFQYEEISSEEMEDIKSFPEGYQKIESIPSY